MAQPTAFNKTRNFTDWQASNPGTVYSGADLDNEFDDIETTLDETLDNLAIIQRDDGNLANQSVHPDAFSAAALVLIAADWTPRSLWITSTAYVVGDVVEESGGGSYVCAVAHTSGTFATDHTAGKWIVISAGNSAADIAVTPAGALAATDVQAALEELDSDLTAHLSDAVDAHDASAISNVAAGNIVATTVQAAIDELDSEKGGKAIHNTWTKAQGTSSVALTDAATIATNASLGNVFSVTLGGNRTLQNPTNMVAGFTYIWNIDQDGTGSRTLAYDTSFKFPGGAAPVLSTSANAKDSLACVYDGTVLRCSITKDFR